MKRVTMKRGEVSSTLFFVAVVVVVLALQARGYMPRTMGYSYPRDGYGFLPDPYAQPPGPAAVYESIPFRSADYYYQDFYYRQ